MKAFQKAQQETFFGADKAGQDNRNLGFFIISMTSKMNYSGVFYLNVKYICIYIFLSLHNCVT